MWTNSLRKHGAWHRTNSLGVLSSLKCYVPVLFAFLFLAIPLPGFAQSQCDAGKLQCVRDKVSCLMRVYETAAKFGAPPNQAALQKCMDTFDGGADPSRACFARPESKVDANCSTTGDAPHVATLIDEDVQTYVETIAPGVVNTIQVTCNRDGEFVASDHPLFADPTLDPDYFSMWEFGGLISGFTAPRGINIVCRAVGFFSNLPTVPIDVTDRVSWSTEVPAVAAVAPGGIVTTIAIGATAISATLESVSGSDTVQVNGGTLLEIEVANRIGEQDPLSRPVGTTIPYGAIGNYGVDGGAMAQYDITEFASWSTSNGSVASVNNSTDKGLVTTHTASGTPVDIIAQGQGITGVVELNVTF
jgi:hypothetical protein